MFKHYRHYCSIILISILLRILWAAAVPVIPVSASYAYDTFAQNLADGQGYGWNSTSLTAYRPVGTSFVYCQLYRVFGHAYLSIVILIILLTVVIIAVLMHLAEIWFNRRSAVITGLILAL